MRFKKWLSQLLVGFIRTLNAIDLRLTNYAVTENPKGYEDLAPSQYIEKSENYFEALSYALRNPEIKNIALTGTYGSGKSSILKAYQAANKQYSYLNISLATFDDKVHDKEEDRQKIEISILQQMFYHVKHRNIPDSRFKRIRKLTSGQQVRISILTIVWIIASGITMKINFFKGLPLLQKLETKDYYLPTAFLLFVGGAILLIYYLSRSFRNTKFNKLNFIKGEIEISELGDASVLNTYLDEILYFFEVNPFNVVIIEDLDRFQDPSIFTKLREINNLLNNSMQIHRKIVFIYAIKDEMFVERNRAKGHHRPRDTFRVSRSPVTIRAVHWLDT